jgi:hypothetical protein
LRTTGIIGEAWKQEGKPDSYLRNLANDSMIDSEKLISELFDQLRVAATNRFPCFNNKFDHILKSIWRKSKNEKC